MERLGFSMIASGFALGLSIGNLVHILADDGNERVHDVQVHNEQVREQLDGRYDDIGRLILNDEDGTFHFNAGNGETCEGEYEAKTKSIKVVGKLSCTHAEEL